MADTGWRRIAMSADAGSDVRAVTMWVLGKARFGTAGRLDVVITQAALGEDAENVRRVAGGRCIAGAVSPDR